MTPEEIQKITNIQNHLRFNPRCSIETACNIYELDLTVYQSNIGAHDYLSTFQELINLAKNGRGNKRIHR